DHPGAEPGRPRRRPRGRTRGDSLPPGDDARRGARARARAEAEAVPAGALAVRCRRCQPLPEEVARAADLLGRRWVLAILWASAEGGAVRFNEFKQAIDG